MGSTGPNFLDSREFKFGLSTIVGSEPQFPRWKGEVSVWGGIDSLKRRVKLTSGIRGRKEEGLGHCCTRTEKIRE